MTLGGVALLWLDWAFLFVGGVAMLLAGLALRSRGGAAATIERGIERRSGSML